VIKQDFAKLLKQNKIKQKKTNWRNFANFNTGKIQVFRFKNKNFANLKNPLRQVAKQDFANLEGRRRTQRY